MLPEALLTAGRKELNQISLYVREGRVPDDLHGFVFFNSVVGTVNTNGLPYKETYPDGTTAQEYGTPITNGDGLIIKLDLTKKGQVLLSTGLMRTPCFYADEATMRGTVWHKKYGFRNFGTARISLKMGMRNSLNAAVQPVKFGNDRHTRLLAACDAGRPFEFDPHTLNPITPVGKNGEWCGGHISSMPVPFATVFTTAHPFFDPRTRELFTFKSGRSDTVAKAFTELIAWADTDPKSLEEFIRDVMRTAQNEIPSREDFFKTIIEFARRMAKRHAWKQTLREKIQNWLENKILNKPNDCIGNKNAVCLLRWTGKGALQQWKVADADGNELPLQHNTYQIGCSKNYVILMRSACKHLLEMILSNMFPDKPDINAFVCKCIGSAHSTRNITDIYLIRRADLHPNKKKVKAQKIVVPIQAACFSVDYDDSGDIITIFSSSHCSDCSLSLCNRATSDAQESAHKSELSNHAERIDKIVIDARRGVYFSDRSGCYCNTDPQGAHTLGIGMHTYRNMRSADHTAERITHIYLQSRGGHADVLTDFTRKQAAARPDVPCVIFCLNTERMTAEDFYVFDKETYFWSLQFVPRAVPRTDLPPCKDGYILTTLTVGFPRPEGGCDYRPEVWIFDANRLAQGAICKLNHPDMSFGFTRHSAWTPDAHPNLNTDYKIDIKKDYDCMIDRISDKQTRQEIGEIFRQYVYPNF